jgi:hypothetical protein
MVIAAQTASGKSSPDGLAYDVKSKVDELITEVNAISAVVPNLDAAELAVLNGVVAGAASASKAAVLGANKQLDEFHTAALYLGAAAGTLVDASAAELNAAAGKNVLALTTVAAAALVIPVTHRMVFKTTGAGAEACTLADGVHGQLLTVYLDVDGGGDATITPATKNGFTTVVLADPGDQVTLQFFTGLGWTLMGATGVAAPPAITV